MKQIILIALVCAALLFGCAGSEQKQPAAGGVPQGNGPATGGSPATGGNAGATGGSPATGGNSGASGGASQTAQNAFDNLLAMLKLNTGWKVVYQLSGTDMQGTSEISQYVKGMQKFRSDVTAAGMETRTYVVDSNAYLCSKLGASWSCMKFAIPQNDSSQSSYQLENQLQTDSSKYTVTADGTMQVAGTTATCFKVVSTEGNTRYCVSAEGVPLYVLSNAQSEGKAVEFEMKAKSYSTAVSDSDFVLPAEAKEINLPSGDGSGAGDLCAYCDYLTGSDKTECLATCGS